MPLLLLLPSPSLPAPVADRQLEVGRDLIEAHRSASRTDYEVNCINGFPVITAQLINASAIIRSPRA